MHPALAQVNKRQRVAAVALYHLLIHDTPGRTTNDLAAPLGLSTRVAQQALAELQRVGIATKRRQGNAVTYYPAQGGPESDGASHGTNPDSSRSAVGHGTRPDSSRSRAARSGTNPDSSRSASGTNPDSSRSAVGHGTRPDSRRGGRLESSPRKLADVIAGMDLGSSKELINLESNRIESAPDGVVNGRGDADKPPGQPVNGHDRPNGNDQHAEVSPVVQFFTAKYVENVRTDLLDWIVDAEGKLGENGGSRDRYAKALGVLERYGALNIWHRALGEAVEVPKAEIRKSRGAIFNRLLDKLAGANGIDLITGQGPGS